MSPIQVKKENVKQKILDAAQAEFLEKGYQKASLRDIAKRAEVTKGNIYIYFKSKDDLFSALVQPVLDLIIKEMEEDYERGMYDKFYEPSYFKTVAREQFYDHVKRIQVHRDSMKLLLYCSSETSYVNFREQVAEKYEEATVEFFKYMKATNPKCKGDVSYLFIHACAQLYISFIEEIIIHEPDEDELNKYIENMAHFMYSGVKGVLEQ